MFSGPEEGGRSGGSSPSSEIAQNLNGSQVPTEGKEAPHFERGGAIPISSLFPPLKQAAHDSPRNNHLYIY